MNNTKKTIKLFTQRFFILLVIYQFLRIGFYLYNKTYFPEIDAQIFIGGLIFDLAALGYINILFAILHLIPGKFQQNKKYQNFIFYSFFITNSIFICTNFIDYQYFKFIGRRSSFSMLMADGMTNEIGGLLISYFIDFWQIPLFMVLTIFCFWFILKKIDYREIKTTTKLESYASLLLSISILFIAGRGINRKPLSIVDAPEFGPIGTSALVLNTSFTVIKTLSPKDNLKEIKYFTEEEAEFIFNPIQTFKHTETKEKNVVILILESFGKENIQRGQTPFLDSLIQKSYYFENAFANGKVSMDALPATISSIPGLMNKTYISSNYCVNEVFGLTKLLEKNGYNTSFFHGAFNGSQNFDRYTDLVGFDKYYGKDEYIGIEAFDQKWGIFDEEFLQFTANELNSFKQPFFTTIFTISSHAPYVIPEKHKNKFPKGTTEIQESIAYADYSVKKFFETIQKMPWYKNTIFVITADHTSSTGEEPEYKNNVGKFRIPIMFFSPSDDSLIGVHSKNFQQTDIFPSLIDYLGLNATIISYGKSYKSKDDFVVNYLDNIYNLEMGDYYLAFDGTKTLGLYNWKIDPLLKDNLSDKNPELKQKMERFIKAYIQSFNHRVSKNKLTVQ